MLGEAIAEFILRPVLEIILQLIGYLTTRVFFPLISFGHILVAPSPKGVKVYPRWHGLDRASNGKIIHEEMGALLGIIIWCVIIGVGVCVY